MNHASLDFRTTVKGSLLEGFYPAGWDLDRIDHCCTLGLDRLLERRPYQAEQFTPVPVDSVQAMDLRMGDAIADQIEQCRQRQIQLALILPVGPMGMYRRVVERLRKTGVACDHVHTFNMDEWSDRNGRTMPGDAPGGFEQAMGAALFDPLGELTVPKKQRHFATRDCLPRYADRIAQLRRDGGRLVTVYGIGRTCHIAFWEPQIAGEMDEPTWRAQTHRLGQALHPLTIEQNSLHSFMSRFTLIPCWANTIGPGLFLQSDLCIGGADGIYPGRGATWQAMSLCVTLAHGPSPWLPATYMPTLPGQLFFIRDLAGPLTPDAH